MGGQTLIFSSGLSVWRIMSAKRNNLIVSFVTKYVTPRVQNRKKVNKEQIIACRKEH